MLVKVKKYRKFLEPYLDQNYHFGRCYYEGGSESNICLAVNKKVA